MKSVVLTRPQRSATAYQAVAVKVAEHNSGKGFDDKLGNTGNREYGVEKTPKGVLSSPPVPLSQPVVVSKKGSAEEGLDKVINLASQLTAEQRKELLARLALGQQAEASRPTRDQEMWSEAVYQGLKALNGAQDDTGHGFAFKRVLSSSTAWRPVQDFMQHSDLAKLKVVERQSVYQMLAKLVVQNARWIARKSGAPVSAKLVGNCAANVGSLFDNAFPGYLESGLALLVAKRLTMSHGVG